MLQISCIIPTYKREDMLARAVESVLKQEFDGDIEITVINDSGEPLTSANWQADPRVRVLMSFRTERCVARNVGAALSNGKYLHFLDDDDYLTPGAYGELFERAEVTGAVWTYGAYNLVDDNSILISTALKPSARGKVFALALAGLAIPTGVSLIRRDAFFKVGCFDVSQIVEEDTELLQRIARIGSVEFTNFIVANYRTGVTEVSTSHWDKVDSMGIRKREKAFAEPDCVKNIVQSLAGLQDKRIYGRLTRFLCGSVMRHLKSSPLTALSRALIAIRFTIPGLFSPRFYSGLKGD